jgi:hypothetical protein
VITWEDTLQTGEGLFELHLPLIFVPVDASLEQTLIDIREFFVRLRLKTGVGQW